MKSNLSTRQLRHRWLVALCGVVAFGLLILGLTQLDYHPAPSRSDLYTKSELVSLSADCGAVGTLVFEGSHPELNSDARTPDPAWAESCEEQIQPQATIGFVSMCAGILFAAAALILGFRGPRSARFPAPAE
jgi:hypothetical protein